MKVEVEVFEKWFSIDVLPSDSVWTLKWKIYENADIRKQHKDILPPSPDDQSLRHQDENTTLYDCERSLESYSIHEGSELSCEKKSLCLSFRGLLNVYRKKDAVMDQETDSLWSLTGFTPFLLVKHASIHIHEVPSIRLQLKKNQSQHLKSLIHCVIHSMSSLRKLDLSGNSEIVDEGYILIAEALTTNTSLKMLNLHYAKNMI
eukprot:TRINITY_DN2317_c0_g1_i2.p1 TRINITY_DN2317_c0_g1~~TRINITY_DN2317_c0_g1_i2.p1  ORF type:complete len:204 (-),score=55.33 TRINITY_DN2317_c0_g1_i2:458-1069(-)